MAELPTGTVTFLFTDVEGSTRLLDELGSERYAEALARHRRLIRKSCRAYGGVEVDTQGDSFFIAFARASDAVSAAEHAQRDLAAGPVRVRMGLHTGEPLKTREGYVGADVHKAARIADAGHGGQVLVSTSTCELLDDRLKDLGEHRLKDLSAPERLYQLGDGEFPPLRSLYRTNLPLPATPFLGRERELQDVTALLGREDVRLLTLTGPGGAGKTRLALQSAAEIADSSFPDGVRWVSLAEVHDPSFVLPAIAQALEVAEEPTQSLAEVLTTELGGKRVLVVLDSVEHLLPDAVVDIGLLRDVAGPAVLVTSRERLQLQGEHVYDVPALAPDDAAELFLARARSLGSPLERSDALDELCRRLDHLPLAIELAAARTRLFSVEQLLGRLGERFDLLKAGRDSDPRQQTLSATIEWSHDLLDDPERKLFRRLSVFSGSCSFEAVEAVCDADPDTLQSLLDKSLLRRRDVAAGPRYWMLETIREFAILRLDATPEAQGFRRRHAEHFLAIADEIALRGERASLFAEWSRVDGEDDANFRAALGHADETRDAELELRLAVALWGLFWARGLWVEGRRALESALNGGAAAPPALRGRALVGAGFLADRQADWQQVEKLGSEYVALSRDLGDEEGLVRGMRWLSHAAAARGDAEGAARLIEESERYAQRAPPSRVAALLVDRALSKLADGDYSAAEALLHDALELAEQPGGDAARGAVIGNLAVLALLRGRHSDAVGHLREVVAAVEGAAQQEATFFALSHVGVLAAETGDEETATQLWGAADAFGRTLGAVLDDAEKGLQERAAQKVRAQLGDVTFEALWAQGGALSTDRAIEMARDLVARAGSNAPREANT
ncbi:MAG: adenylate/guanylate cyclase domain-containing protein [Actinomycetota bacterium]